jgi:lysozyme
VAPLFSPGGIMQTSAQGVTFLERHEGVVLRAYRCPAGVWTIGAGLTAASGVVKPKAGMTITAAEATRLLQEALRRNYEPAVARAMARKTGPRQHEFDAGVSFHFNTGAIGRASWVKRWMTGDGVGTRAALKLWKKGGGKVLPGLVRRREEEADLLQHAQYGHSAPVRPAPPRPGENWSRIAAPVTAAEVPAIREALDRLGYAVGDDTDRVRAGAVRQFQRDHGLTDDGIIGRATASALQRVLDARRRAAGATTATVATSPVAVTDIGPELAGLPDWAGAAALGVALAYALWLAWTYRDALAPAVQSVSPRLAALLRSF